MKLRLKIFLLLLLGLSVLMVVWSKQNPRSIKMVEQIKLPKVPPHPLSIAALRQTKLTKSQLVIEETLAPGSNYQRYYVSYRSDDLKLYGYLTVPNGPQPKNGYPAIIFNHGYIPPEEYRSTERYIAYTDAFSRSGYVLLRPDYRGHGESEGLAEGGYGSNAYTIDVLNALNALKRYSAVDPHRIGMWGHSMGGHITLRSMVVRQDIRAGVIWSGVVASYEDLFYNWRRTTPRPTFPPGRFSWRQTLVDLFGEPRANPQFWHQLSATNYLGDLSGPIELHHGTADESVPYEFSQALADKAKQGAKHSVTLYLYPGDDHNLTASFNIAMERSLAFFDQHLK